MLTHRPTCEYAVQANYRSQTVACNGVGVFDDMTEQLNRFLRRYSSSISINERTNGTTGARLVLCRCIPPPNDTRLLAATDRIVMVVATAVYDCIAEHSNSRFESILFDSLCESIRIDSFCKKNRPFDSLVGMQFLH